MTRNRTLRWMSAGLFALAAVIAMPAAADFVINDDLIVDGSACIGFDCVNGESFGFDTLRLKEHNLRIKFDDTSTASSFPRNDWQLTANASANGGQSKFSIDDISGSRTPFTIEANARSHSLYVDDGGRIGSRTSTPAVEIHTIDGDTPTLRLQQDGSSGFGPQTWDIAGNETNFFVRDVTNGSTLPFRIRPGAPSSSIFTDVSGDVGLGTSSPDEELEIARSDNDDLFVLLTDTSSTSQNVGFSYANGSATWNVFNTGVNGQFALSVTGMGNMLTIDDATGDVTINQGDLIVSAGDCSDQAGGGGCTPDYVFEPDYDLPTLAELGAFVAENKHLPNVPSAADNEENGVSMRRLSFAMLEKVEELVLYTLDQQRTIDDQQETITELRDRITRLEAEREMTDQ